MTEMTLIGCGAMGRAIALGLDRLDAVTQLHLCDADLTVAEGLVHELARSGNIEGYPHAIDVMRADTLPGRGPILAALPWPETRQLALTCARLRRDMMSITRPDYADIDDLKKLAEASGIMIVLPCGVEPGLTEIYGLSAARDLADCDELAILCGGVPRHQVRPLNHAVLFGSTLPVGLRPAYARLNGTLQRLERFMGLEKVSIPGVGYLEAHHDGLMPVFAETVEIEKIPTVTQKTLRRPGFVDAVLLLHKCGFFNKGTIDVKGTEISPFDVATSILLPKMRSALAVDDVTVLQVSAIGRDECGVQTKIRWQILQEADQATGLTGMAQITGYTAAFFATHMMTGQLRRPGLVLPYELTRSHGVAKLTVALVRLGIKVTRRVTRDPLSRRAQPVNAMAYGVSR